MQVYHYTPICLLLRSNQNPSVERKSETLSQTDTHTKYLPLHGITNKIFVLKIQRDAHHQKQKQNEAKINLISSIMISYFNKMYSVDSNSTVIL